MLLKVFPASPLPFPHGENGRIAGRRRIGVDQFRRDRDAAARSGFGACGAQVIEHAIAARAVDVANVGLKTHARRDAVDRAGKDLADADGGHGVDGAGRFGRCFERQNQFGRRGQRVFAARHQLAAGVAAFAFDDDAQAGRRGDVRHEATSMPSCFEDGPCSMCSSTNW